VYDDYFGVFQLAVNTMAMVFASFFCVITDRRIGGAYCTLLHSCSNFGTRHSITVYFQIHSQTKIYKVK